MEEGIHLIWSNIGVFLFCLGVALLVKGMRGVASLETYTGRCMYQQHVLSVYDGWSER
ncbi:MAG: hypothetical protein PUB10_07915 [Clostridiales bacterium]|nr:hypothetical protein [Clostridiales bacterium]